MTIVKRHGGFAIEHSEDGYYWENGGDGGGYYETVQECADSIDRYNAGFEKPHDSPSLSEPWWAYR